MVYAKAARLPVHDNGDGSWRVTGDDGTYSVYRIGDALRCTCPAGHGSTVCSHRLAVKHIDSPPAPQIALDTLTAEELTAMSIHELGRTLNSVIVAISAVASERQAQNTRLADLKIRLNRYKLMGETEKLDAVRDEAILQKSIVENLRIRHSAMKELKSALQSTTVGGVGG
jgi:hypothetical protein